MTHDEMIAVILAHRDGKTVQIRSIEQRSNMLDTWYDHSPLATRPSWNFCEFEYRIKPEAREVWIDVVPQPGMQDASTGVSTGPRPGWTKFREVIE